MNKNQDQIAALRENQRLLDVLISEEKAKERRNLLRQHSTPIVHSTPWYQQDLESENRVSTEAEATNTADLNNWSITSAVAGIFRYGQNTLSRREPPSDKENPFLGSDISATATLKVKNGVGSLILYQDHEEQEYYTLKIEMATKVAKDFVFRDSQTKKPISLPTSVLIDALGFNDRDVYFDMLGDPGVPGVNQEIFEDCSDAPQSNFASQTTASSVEIDKEEDENSMTTEEERGIPPPVPPNGEKRKLNNVDPMWKNSKKFDYSILAAFPMDEIKFDPEKKDYYIVKYGNKSYYVHYTCTMRTSNGTIVTKKAIFSDSQESHELVDESEHNRMDTLNRSDSGNVYQSAPYGSRSSSLSGAVNGETSGLKGFFNMVGQKAKNIMVEDDRTSSNPPQTPQKSYKIEASVKLSENEINQFYELQDISAVSTESEEFKRSVRDREENHTFKLIENELILNHSPNHYRISYKDEELFVPRNCKFIYRIPENSKYLLVHDHVARLLNPNLFLGKEQPHSIFEVWDSAIKNHPSLPGFQLVQYGNGLKVTVHSTQIVPSESHPRRFCITEIPLKSHQNAYQKTIDAWLTSGKDSGGAAKLRPEILDYITSRNPTILSNFETVVPFERLIRKINDTNIHLNTQFNSFKRTVTFIQNRFQRTDNLVKPITECATMFNPLSDVSVESSVETRVNINTLLQRYSDLSQKILNENNEWINYFAQFVPKIEKQPSQTLEAELIESTILKKKYMKTVSKTFRVLWVVPEQWRKFDSVFEEIRKQFYEKSKKEGIIWDDNFNHSKVVYLSNYTQKEQGTSMGTFVQNYKLDIAYDCIIFQTYAATGPRFSLHDKMFIDHLKESTTLFKGIILVDMEYPPDSSLNYSHNFVSMLILHFYREKLVKDKYNERMVTDLFTSVRESLKSNGDGGIFTNHKRDLKKN